MRPRLVVTRFNAAKPGRQPSRWRAWVLWLSFAFFGMAIGLWRTPPPYARLPGAREAQRAAKSNIAEANNLASTDEIKVGQLLLLPGAASPRPVQTASRSSSFIWPADGSVTSSFGWRIHPISGEELFHEGMDIAAYTGANVYAAASGTVAYCGWYGGYGRLIMIKHADGLETRYGHLSGYTVSEGDEVATGELIGYAGESGSTTGPNLHFEIRRSGKPVNPRDYLP